jgi:hypothetical protein
MNKTTPDIDHFQCPKNENSRIANVTMIYINEEH